MVQGKTTTPLAYYSSAGGGAVTLSLLQNAASRGARTASGSTSVVLAKSESEGCATCSAIKPSTEDVFIKKVRAAWKRIGPTFMQDWEPHTNVTLPFALVAFGDPTKALRKPTEPLEVLRDRVRA